jgi:membrane-associated phospholipid phosphatase
MPPKYFAVVAACLAAFLVLIIWLVWTGLADSIDFPIREAILTTSSPIGLAIWKEITFLGSTIAITGFTVLCILLFALRSEWQTALHMGVVMVGASIIDVVLKWAVHRPRPIEFFPHTMPTSYSFPSGHALFSLAFYITIAMIIVPLVNKFSQAIIIGTAILVVATIGASRIFLGVHYLSDIMGGYIAAALWLTMLHWWKQTRH